MTPEPSHENPISILPPIPGIRFHHFGLAVRTPERAFQTLAALGYTPGNAVFDPRQRVNLAMRHHADMPDVEVIWPGDEPSPIDALLKRSDTSIYHLCFTCTDAAAVIAGLEAAGSGVMLVSPPTPALLFAGQPVSFYVVDGFGLIELLQTSDNP